MCCDLIHCLKLEKERKKERKKRKSKSPGGLGWRIETDYGEHKATQSVSEMSVSKVKSQVGQKTPGANPLVSAVVFL